MDTSTIREAVGAGRWFSSSKDELTQQVDKYINSAMSKIPKIDGKILGCIAPHAGFEYSGPTAGYDFAALKKDAELNGQPDTVFVIGFSHSKHFNYAAIMDGKAIKTPICTTEIDFDSIKIMCNGRKYIKCNYQPHYGEHSAENEIPFVQRTFPNAKIVVILVGTHESNVFQEVADGLGDVSKQKKIYVVASSDMLHHENHALVEKVDRETIALTEKMDYQGLLKKWDYENQIYCGITAVIPTMIYCVKQNCNKAVTLDLTNSEIVTKRMNSGWCVGYGAVIFVA